MVKKYEKVEVSNPKGGTMLVNKQDAAKYLKKEVKEEPKKRGPKPKE